MQRFIIAQIFLVAMCYCYPRTDSWSAQAGDAAYDYGGADRGDAIGEEGYPSPSSSSSYGDESLAESAAEEAGMKKYFPLRRLPDMERERRGGIGATSVGAAAHFRRDKMSRNNYGESAANAVDLKTSCCCKCGAFNRRRQATYFILRNF